MRPWLALLFFCTPAAWAELPIVSTRHNLSVSGPGTVKAASETQVCIFCHVPHHGAGLGLNRPSSAAAYTPYASTTLVSSPPGSPSGATRTCLSCHDGTIALGQTLGSGLISMTNAGPGGTMPSGPSDLGTDLRTSHPVSFVPGLSPELRTPAAGDPVALDAQGRVQCTSCHDPHVDDLDPIQGNFLVKGNRASAVCTTCHLKSGWGSNPSSHQSSTAFYDTTLGATTPYTTVADNACQSCHRPHGAATLSRNLKDQPSQVCLQCHTGKVAQKDLGADFAKPYVHPALTSNPADHDDSEGPLSRAYPLPETSASQARHVQCVDCHNPHASFVQSALAPRANGTLSGVWGIDRTGAKVDPVQNGYEVCFKCHADSVNQPQALGPTPPETVTRAVRDVNLRRVVDLGAPSYHPIEGPGRSSNVPGLLAPWTTSSVLYCSDCHASDQSPAAGGAGPAGPHGSTYPHLLALNLTTLDNTAESPSAYALCYRCHDRTTLFSPRSGFPLHATHVQQDAAPCSACHDWHGVSVLQGNPTNNAHLINFDISIVQPTPSGVRQYSSTGAQHGTCALTCHGHTHSPSSY